MAMGLQQGWRKDRTHPHPTSPVQPPRPKAMSQPWSSKLEPHPGREDEEEQVVVDGDAHEVRAGHPGANSSCSGPGGNNACADPPSST